MASIFQALLNRLKTMNLRYGKQTPPIDSKEAERIKKRKKMSYYCDLKRKFQPVQVYKKSSYLSSSMYSTRISANRAIRAYTVYFQSFRSDEEEALTAEKKVLFGIGIVIEDGNGTSVFKSGKGLVGNEDELSSEVVQIMNFIEGLKAATSLGLKKINIVSDDDTVFRFITGRLGSKWRHLAALIKQATVLVSKVRYCHGYVMNKDDTLDADAVKLAKEAITIKRKELFETCKICFTDTYIEKMVSADDCRHLYCLGCMKKHVDVKVLQVMGLPKCPHQGCASVLKLDSCRKFLTKEVFDLLNERVKEATIPVSQKVYCPYPRCSALMSKHSVQVDVNGATKCTKCGGLFCMGCQVAWHSSMTCSSYKQSNPPQFVEEARVKAIAKTNLWRQCSMCQHMVSLSLGCYHITCRCGHQFCYKCGAEWKKIRTCTCPCWDETNIVYR